DEAVHADKFRLLLEEGLYTYDPHEYHGPTLNYLTLLPARLTGATNLTQVSEFTLRIVPVICGVCLILMLLLIARGLGTGAAAYAAVLTAISPAMVFYSRYYIQEMLLVCFTFGAIASGYRYTQSKSLGWALSAGVFLGLMHATKETCIIAFGSMCIALLLAILIRRQKDSFANAANAAKPSHLIAGLAAGAVVSALLHSSLLSNPGGILDSIRTYTTYLSRADGNGLHDHPWHYYLKMLVYFRFGGGPIWTEVLIVILAIVGFTAAITRKGLSAANPGLPRFIAFYALIMTAVYSAIPYKTPWCMLGFLHGMILLAGLGAVTLVRLMPNVVPRLMVLLLLLGVSVHLTWQSYQSSYNYYADSRNPYVYAHPTPEIFTVVEKIEEYAGVHEDGRNMPIDVICPGGDYWPLPWYLRSFTGVRWSNQVVNDTSSAPLIIASDKVENALANKLYTLTPLEERQMYLYLFDRPYYVWLRPKVKLTGLVRKDLWSAPGAEPVEADRTPAEGEK
ncbi:MAG: flippase activity-associated protein Agl23, partial [Planctomycetota bacterium]